MRDTLQAKMAYVGLHRCCGGLDGAVVDAPRIDVARWLRDFARWNLVVERCTVEEARARTWGHKPECDRAKRQRAREAF